MTDGSSLMRERILSKVLPEPNSGCWLWDAFVHPTGYAVLRADGKSQYAHRLSYEAFVGPVPSGLQLDHLCRIRSCVNPSHLEPVTPKENTRRGLNMIPRTHCRKGHEFSDDNLYWYLGRRQCRKCRQACQRRHAEKMRHG